MKHYKLIAALIFFTFCNKELDQQPIGFVLEPEVTNKNGVEGLLIGAYSLLDGVMGDDMITPSWASAGSNWIYGSICGSEAYKGSEDFDQGEMITPLETFNGNSRNSGLSIKWAIVYAGVQRSNEVLKIMGKAVDIKQEDQRRIAAEARFLRGFYHFEAIKLWNKVPYVDETISYQNQNFHLPNDTLIWGAIENDFRFAIDNLPEIMNAVGRANRYVAEAFLAKAFVFQGNLNPDKFLAAKPLLEDLIKNGKTALGVKFALLEHYHENFDPGTKNSSESVFAVQNSVKDQSGGVNGNNGDVLNFPFDDLGNGVPGGCCGFFAPSQYLVNHFKTDPDSGLPDLNNFNDDPVKNDEGLQSSDEFIPYDGPLDPRLDWTVGRRGVPYLDWGIHPGRAWVRFTDYGGPYNPKKNTYSKAQKGSLTDPNFWFPGAVATNINLVRFADILLWAAEVEIEIGSLEKAKDYINMVRRRAANSSGWVKLEDGSPAANYKIGLYSNPWTDKDFARKAVRYERMLELGMEGHRFFDLVRWGIADQEINAYLEKEKDKRIYLTGAFFKKGIHEYFPIPQTQIDLSAGPDGIPKMKQNPGY